jgi:hypothetical protein
MFHHYFARVEYDFDRPAEGGFRSLLLPALPLNPLHRSVVGSYDLDRSTSPVLERPVIAHS